MDLQEYERMYTFESSHWWFRGVRSLALGLLDRFCPPVTPSGLPLRVLDLGCGTGAILTSLDPGRWTVGVDISSEALAFCRKRRIFRLVRSPAEALPVRDSEFHAVLALDLIEHTEEDRRVLAEAVRVLRPGGVLILTVPACPGLWGAHDRALGHRRRYRLRELRERVTLPGVKVEKLSHFNFFLFLPIFLFRKLGRKAFLPAHSGSDLFRFPGPLDALLFALLRLEAMIIERINFPVGVTLFAVLRKK